MTTNILPCYLRQPHEPRAQLYGLLVHPVGSREEPSYLPARQPQRILESVIQSHSVIDQMTSARREVGVLSAFPTMQGGKYKGLFGRKL